MSDAEGRGLLPLKEPFAAGRSAIEQPGLAGTPLEISRERPLQLGVQLANYERYSAGSQLVVHELIAGGFGPVVARVAAFQADSRDGFRILRVTNRSAGVLQLGIRTARLTFAVPIAASVESLTGVTSSIAATVGDAAAGFASTFFYTVAAGQELVCDWWIPPNRTFIAQADVVNVAISCQIEATQARI